MNCGAGGYLAKVINARIGWRAGLIVLVTCLMSACSGSSGQEPVKTVTQRFLDAVGARDFASACSVLAPRARDSLARGNDTCESTLSSVALPRDPVGTVEVWSDEAQVKTAADTVFLHEFSTGWQITGAGCRPENEQVYSCAVGGP
ncbi:MAG: hypothetical protein QOI21_146 [Actinomycetota bacterium]|nr:hypothetical protein [Actinomycetota bacterium]